MRSTEKLNVLHRNVKIISFAARLLHKLQHLLLFLRNPFSPFSFPQLIKGILRGIMISVRNSLWQTVYIVSLLLLSLIPVVGWVTPVFTILIECYYYGFSMLDYSCERHNLTTGESIHFIGNRKGLAIGNGLLFYLMHLVPIIGWVLAPAYAVIAATLSIRPMKNRD